MYTIYSLVVRIDNGGWRMALEYTMIEPCRTLLKFFEKFHRTVVQISFLDDHVQ